MAEDVVKSVRIRIENIGVSTARAELDAIQKEIEEINRSLGSDAADPLADSFNKARRAAEQMRASYADGFAELLQGVRNATKELRNLAQESVVAGGRNPLADMAAGMSLEDAQEIRAVLEAESLTAGQVANKVIADEQRKTQARQQAAEQARRIEQQYLASVGQALDANMARQSQAAQYRIQMARNVTNAEKELAAAQANNQWQQSVQGLSAADKATKELTRAQQTLAEAERNVARARKTNDPRQIIPALQAQTRATNEVTRAQAAHAAATQATSAATSQLTGSLPRMRYALYDISTTLAIAGGAMVALSTATAATAIKMDREFADVVRTTGAYMDETGQQALALRDDFNLLFTTLPASWSDLAEIGTLAGQLGIAQENVTEFTNLVAKFATVSDVSVEQSATAFGRLAELLDVPASEFENLGSSILAVGINSVATEGQIISTASQIASMGNFAGFSADEVFGLSAALASLGTQPELARGTITRLFTKITKAIAEGGEKLDRFGALAGTSGQEFARAWGDDAAGALQDLLGGLSRVEKSKAIGILDELGITSARDVPTILKLAQNTDVLAQSLQIAADGYAKGTTLQDQYGVVANTVAERLKVLKNNLQQFIATLGGSAGPLSDLIDVLTTVLKGMTAMAEHPFAQGFTLVLGSIVAVTGALALLVGALIRGAASMLAVKQALIETTVATGAFKSASDAAAAGVGRMTLSLKGLRTALIASGIGAAVLALGTAIAYTLGEQEKAAQASKEFENSLSGLGEAVKADTEAFNEASGQAREAFTVYEGAAQSVDSAAKDAENAASVWVGAQGAIRDATDEATDAVERQTIAFGQNTLSFIQNALAQNPAIQELINDPETVPLLEQVGFDWADAINAGMQGGAAGVAEYIDRLKTSLQAGELTMEIDYDDAQRLTDIINNDLYPALNTIGGTIDEQKALADAFSALGGLLGITADGAEDAGYEFAGMEESAKSLADGLFDVINAQIGVIEATYALGGSLAENGLAFDMYSVGGRANIAALQAAMEAAAVSAGDDTALFASLVQKIISDLVSAGAVGVQQLGFVQAALALGTPTNASNDRANAILNGQLASGFNAAAAAARNMGSSTKKAAREAAKEVRTLSDYVSDLSSVLDDAFDFRFGFEQSKDDSITAIQDIATSLSDARDKVRDLRLELQGYRADIQGLKADKGVLQYQLKVAREYGDTVREQTILAELADKNSDLAKAQADLTDTQKELNKAQGDATPTLKGNTESAIDQRAAVLDLVKSYQDQIVAYANTGASQDEVRRYAERLRTEFVRQLTQLGYNRSEIDKYARAFDDAIKIISKLPRNITVRVNSDPAQRALDEFRAKTKSARNELDGLQRQAGKSINLGGFGNGMNSKDVRRESLEKQIENVTMLLNRYYKTHDNMSGYSSSLENRLRDYNNRLRSGNYWSGGFTGQGGMYDYAGAVHRGEYVIPKKDVNQSTGLPYADALSRLAKGTPGRMSYAQGGHVQGFPQMMLVELSPLDRKLLAAAGNVTLSVDGQTLASVTNRHNERNNRLGAGT